MQFFVGNATESGFMAISSIMFVALQQHVWFHGSGANKRTFPFLQYWFLTSALGARLTAGVVCQFLRVSDIFTG